MEGSTILEWLSSHDEQLYNAIEQADLDRLLMITPATFLLPNEATRQKLLEKLEEGEGGSELRSLIVDQKLSTPDDFSNAKNLLNTPVSPGEKVGDQPDYSIWKQGGARHKKRHSKRGGFITPKTTLYGLTKMLEGKTAANIASGEYTTYSPYLYVVVSYLCWLKKNDESAYKKALKQLDYCPMTAYYCIFTPYWNPPNVSQWLSKTNIMCLTKNDVNKYQQMYDEACALYADDFQKSQAMRDKMDDSVQRPGVLREELRKHYKGDTKQAYLDELRFRLHDKLPEICRRANNKAFQDLCFTIEYSMKDHVLMIMQDTFTAADDKLSKIAFYSLAITFSVSDCFCYVPYKVPAGCVSLHSMRSADLNRAKLICTADDQYLRLLYENYPKKKLNTQSMIARTLENADPADFTPELKKVIQELSQKL